MTARTREELTAAAAALTGAMHEVDCSDAASFLGRRARQFEAEAETAPPALTDDAVLTVVGTVGALAAGSVLARVGVPHPVALKIAKVEWGRALHDPLVREELLTTVRDLLAGRCACGEPIGHDDPPGDDPAPSATTPEGGAG